MSIASVYSATNHVQFGFFRGSSRNDPKQLLVGAGQFVRYVKVRKRSDIDEKSFRDEYGGQASSQSVCSVQGLPGCAQNAPSRKR